jgi:hypothetical protein
MIALGVALGACLSCAGAGARGEALVAYAPPGEPTGIPTAPPIVKAREGGPPGDGELLPDGAVADRFTAEGQHATYRFRAERGELALFELGFLGYARGWDAAVGIRVLDGAGDVVLERERAGGASFGALVPFVAPVDGGYRLELRATHEFCRFTVVRHAGFAPNEPGERRNLGAGDRLVGHLADGDDRARIALDLAAGEPAIVAVAPLREHAARQLDKRRREALGARPAALDGMPGFDALLADARAAEAAAGEVPSEPLLQLAHAGATAPLAILAAGEARTVALDVVALGPSEGGLFTVTVERGAPTFPLRGRVGDADDDPVAGARVSLLREPSLAQLAELVTDAEGRFATELPAGTYTVLYHTGPGTRIERVEAVLDEPLELNVVYD